MSGTIGNSCKIPKNVSAVINQRIMKITPQNISFELLPLLINSIIGQTQLERIGTGGVQTNISSSDILNILIPIINNKIQTKIEDKIKESFNLKQSSKQLLEVAKKAVEIAIENGESEAMEYIKGKV
jgi:restriction endonuclease S subunit